MRRTKEEAARTRAAILDAGLACFDRRGIAGTTLDHIAAAAGVTKGAIYHHFGGKGAILRGIREQVSLPLLDQADTALLTGRELPALERVERFLVSVVERLERDPRQRRALSVMLFKCEYVGELSEQLANNLRSNVRLTRAFEAAYRAASREKALRRGVDPAIAACETAMFFSGLIRLWLLHAPRSVLRRGAKAAIRQHVRSRGA
jgi:TetR/AcrR family acrAB operon transcriptional repressor